MARRYVITATCHTTLHSSHCAATLHPPTRLCHNTGALAAVSAGDRCNCTSPSKGYKKTKRWHSTIATATRAAFSVYICMLIWLLSAGWWLLLLQFDFYLYFLAGQVSSFTLVSLLASIFCFYFLLVLCIFVPQLVCVCWNEQRAVVGATRCPVRANGVLVNIFYTLCFR